MADISAELVKELRELTGAGMMDCKKALVEASGDKEKAIDVLRKKGLSSAAKKAGRVAAEGLVAVAASDKKASIVEVNAETDFVARNDAFQQFTLQAAKIALETGADAEALKAKPYPGSASVQDALTNLIATVGENMNIRRARVLSVSQGIVATYVHNALAPNLGKIGVLVALESAADAAKLMELGKHIAMHIAATNPISLSIEQVDPKALEREQAIFTEQAKASGKDEKFIPKMVEGRTRKFFEESVLFEQTYVRDPEGKLKVKDVVANAGKEWNAPVTLAAFVRFQLGEGIEKAQDDFAAEVAKMAS